MTVKTMQAKGSRTRRGPGLLPVIGALTTLAVLLLIVLPVLWMTYTSFRPENEIGRTIEVSLQGFTSENYDALLRYGFWTNVLNSLGVALASALGAAVFGLLGAYGFSRFEFVGKRIVMILILALQLFPFVMLVGPLYGIYSVFGLVNNFGGLVIAYIAIAQPFAVFMMLGYLNTIPKSLDEAASIDGAGRIQTLVRVILPLSWPGLVAVVIYTFSLSWDEFIIASVLMTRSDTKTLPVALAGLFGEFSTQYGVVMAAAVIGTLPTFLIFLFLQRYMVSSLAGAVKQ